LADNSTILRLRNLRSGYGEIEVLKGLSADVLRGDIFSVIGANGAGKSTLLRTLFGIVRATQGEIQSDGVEISRLSPFEILKLGITYVPQGRSNFPAMSIQENLEMGAYTRHDSDGVAADIERLCRQFPILGEKRQAAVGNLSGGQQQILEMAIALMLNPKVLLIDEPTLGLAPTMVDSVFNAIRDINELGTTVVMVEQNAKRALEISDRGIVLDLGAVRFEGTGEELLYNPDVRSHYLGL
jgi:branched-chain amino acid transport system ATP-binding protein